MRVRDVIKTHLRGSRDEFTLFSTGLQREITIRRNSRDLDVFLKVLGQHEYKYPALNRPQLIIDGGANIGVSALYFAHRYPEARIYAIEPEPNNYDLLTRNCRHVAAIEPRHGALWGRTANLDLRDSKCETWSFSIKETSEESGIASITIPELIAQSGFEHIDLLKLDIEGAEKELFSSGCESWLSNVKHITIELHDRFVPGCSETFYAAILGRKFAQEICGENVTICFR